MLVILTAGSLARSSAFEAFAQEREQLFRAAKTHFTASVDFLDPAVEMVSRRPGFGSKLENERPSHHFLKLR
jgi:hypothetical protein